MTLQPTDPTRPTDDLSVVSALQPHADLSRSDLSRLLADPYVAGERRRVIIAVLNGHARPTDKDAHAA